MRGTINPQGYTLQQDGVKRFVTSGRTEPGVSSRNRPQHRIERWNAMTERLRAQYPPVQ
jgi:hypothetical protein